MKKISPALKSVAAVTGSRPLVEPDRHGELRCSGGQHEEHRNNSASKGKPRQVGRLALPDTQRSTQRGHEQKQEAETDPTDYLTHVVGGGAERVRDVGETRLSLGSSTWRQTDPEWKRCFAGGPEIRRRSSMRSAGDTASPSAPAISEERP
jgi:hypothetical protein